MNNALGLKAQASARWKTGRGILNVNALGRIHGTPAFAPQMMSAAGRGLRYNTGSSRASEPPASCLTTFQAGVKGVTEALQHGIAPAPQTH